MLYHWILIASLLINECPVYLHVYPAHLRKLGALLIYIYICNTCAVMFTSYRRGRNQFIEGLPAPSPSRSATSTPQHGVIVISPSPRLISPPLVRFIPPPARSPSDLWSSPPPLHLLQRLPSMSPPPPLHPMQPKRLFTEGALRSLSPLIRRTIRGQPGGNQSLKRGCRVFKRSTFQ